jgi:magnesium-transporting ATPase (P-type)
VILELVKALQSYFIECDLDLYDEAADQPGKVQSMSITEELGLVDYVFTDKTETLTCNCMCFRGCCVAGVLYLANRLPYEIYKGTLNSPKDKSRHSHNISVCPLSVGSMELVTAQDYFAEMMLALLVCNDVITDPKSAEYMSSSRDEVALVKAARDYGFKFVERRANEIVVSINQSEAVIEVFAILEFNSELRCMSVIVRHPFSNSVVLYC